MLISHEAGHCLTIDHNDPIPATNDMLMNHVVTHTFLTRVHVLRARRTTSAQVVVALDFNERYDRRLARRLAIVLSRPFASAVDRGTWLIAAPLTAKPRESRTWPSEDEGRPKAAMNCLPSR
jgi:hypothetical protein